MTVSLDPYLDAALDRLQYGVTPANNMSDANMLREFIAARISPGESPPISVASAINRLAYATNAAGRFEELNRQDRDTIEAYIRTLL